MRDTEEKFDSTSGSTGQWPAGTFNQFNNELENIILSADFTLDDSGGPDTNLDMLAQTIAGYMTSAMIYQDSGSADIYTLSISSNLKTISSYEDGMLVAFDAGNDNTGASTVNIAGIGIKDITTPDGTDLEAGVILAGKFTAIVYSSSNDRFELITEWLFASVAEATAGILTDKWVTPAGLVGRGPDITGDILINGEIAIPSGYLECNGQIVSRTTYAGLFALFGARYSEGDGSTTFGLPNIIKYDQFDLNAPSELWLDVAVNYLTGDIFACSANLNVYKQTGGTGLWVDQSAPAASWKGITVNSNTGDVYACETTTNDVYKQTAGTGSWVSQSFSSGDPYAITLNESTGDVFVGTSIDNSIYKQTGGTGTWDDQSAPSISVTGVSVNYITSDVFICSIGGTVYKQTAGTGSWVDQSAPTNNWAGIDVNPLTLDIYLCSDSTDEYIYKQTGGTGDWNTIIDVGASNLSDVDINQNNNDIIICSYDTEIVYKFTSNPSMIKT